MLGAAWVLWVASCSLSLRSEKGLPLVSFLFPLSRLGAGEHSQGRLAPAAQWPRKPSWKGKAAQ